MIWKRGVVLLLGLFCGCTIQYTKSERAWSSPRINVQAAARDGVVAGVWQSNPDAFGGSPFSGGTWVSIEVEETETHRKTVFGRPVDRIDGLLSVLKEGAPEASFRIASEAGEMNFTGTRKGRRYEGEFRFLPDASFNHTAAELLGAPPTPLELMEFCVLGVDRDYLQSVNESAEHRYLASEIISIRRAGVTASFVKEMRAAGLSKTDDLVRMRHGGVQPEFVHALRNADYVLSAEEIVRLRNAGVNADYATGWKQAGFSFSTGDIVRLRNSGVSPEFGRALKAAGLDWAADDIVRLRNAGVSAEYVGNLLAASPSLNPEEIVRLRHAGVSADYFAAWSRPGYGFKPQEIVRLQNAGVPVSWANELLVEGRRPLAAQTIVDLRNRGISPELARKLRE